MKALDPDLKTIFHIANVNSRECTNDELRAADEIMGVRGTWAGKAP